MRYARVDGGDNVIETASHQLPRFTKVGSLAHPVRQLWANGDQAAVFALGWYPVNELGPGFDTTTHKFDGTFTYVKNGNQIDATRNGTPMSAPEITVRLNAERVEKVKEVKAEGLSRINAVMPALETFDQVELVRELWLSIAPAARQPTADLTTITNIYSAGRNAVAAVKALTTIADVRNYNVTTDPSWP